MDKLATMAKHPVAAAALHPASDKKAKMSSDTAKSFPESLTAPPAKSLVPPGQCQFTSDFQSVKLLDRQHVSETSAVLKFSLPDDSKPLNLSTCACILAKAKLPKAEANRENEQDLEEEDVIRPYTPISTNNQIGSFDLLIKNYGKYGRMSRHMHEIPVGSTIEFKHIDKNVKIQAPFSYKKIGMLVGGTGITPMIQALHAILGDKESTTEVSMLYGSKVASDILGMEMLDNWEETSKRLTVTHVLSDEPDDSDWKGERGYISKDLLAKHMPKPELGSDAMIFVCGPPPMYNALCGPREEKELKGLLAEMGYDASQVYKF